MCQHLYVIKCRIEHLAFTQVIYGDTDSIMIHSGLDDLKEVNAIKAKVIKEVGQIVDLSPTLPLMKHR